ncbi:MAG: hypothetical protein E6I86_03635 [Chloroflexi bacterium]|nr:MAG: hypothetical protein E6J51_10705 [Chloroflexota bacterium]TMD49563.1 MAG: hypothetical protein E6I86_03635 [Chloroflexota bacterium]
MAPLCDSCVSDFFKPPRCICRRQTDWLSRKLETMEAVRGNTTTTTTTVRPTYSVRAEQAAWLLTGIVTALLMIRFIFKLLAASTHASFVTFIYNLTQLFVAPFHGIFNTAANGNNVFEPESVVAIVIYVLIGWGLAGLVRVVTRGGGTAS